MEEAVSELSHAQIDSVWSRLQSWVDHQLTLLAAEDNQEQGVSGDAVKEQGSNVSTEQEQGDGHKQKSGTTDGVEGGDSRYQEDREEKTQEKERESQRELRGRSSRNGSHDKVPVLYIGLQLECVNEFGLFFSSNMEHLFIQLHFTSFQVSEGYNEKVLETIADFACMYINIVKGADIYIPSTLLDMAGMYLTVYILGV